MKRLINGLFILVLYYCLIKYIVIDYFPFVLSLVLVFLMISYLKNKFFYNKGLVIIILFLFYFLLSFVFLYIVFYGISYLYMTFKDFSGIYDSIFPILYNQLYINDIIIYFKDFLNNISSYVISGCLSFMRLLPQFFKNYILMIVSSFMFLISYNDIVKWLYKYLDDFLINNIILIKESVLSVLKGYVLTQIKLLIIVFFYLAVGFMVLRVKYAVLLAMIFAFLDSLPFIGVGLGLFPFILIELFLNNPLKALYLFILYIIIVLTRTFLEPKLMNERFKMPVFLLFISMIIHLRLFGFIGVILSPFSLSFLQMYLDNQFHLK